MNAVEPSLVSRTGALEAGGGLPASFGVGGSGTSGGGDFSASLAAALGGEEDRTGTDPREAAEELVAISLVQPVLASLRDSDMGAEPFKASESEKRFGALYDAEIAHRLVKSKRFPLVDALARQMRERMESAGSVTPPGTEAGHADARTRTERYA